MLKKLVKEILVLSSVIGCMPLTSIIAETNPCDSDPYSDACKTYSQKKKNALDAKNKEIAQQKADSEAELAEIKAKRAEIAANIVAYKEEIASYQKQIDDLNSTIAELETQIGALQTQINDTQAKADAKQVEIDDTQAQITQLGEKVKSRMVSSQSGMRIHKEFSILMGASTFQDFLRIANGLSDINAYDNQTTNQLVDLSAQ